MENRYNSYKIVDKPKECWPHRKWVEIFDPLPFEKAVCFDCKTIRDAWKIGAVIQRTIRGNKRSKPRDYSIHFRTIPDGDVYNLYVWKEEKKGGKHGGTSNSISQGES